MERIRFTNLAVQDLTEIWEYTVKTWSQTQADKYYGQLINACIEISEHPNSGKAYNQIFPGLRGKPCSRHIIFFLTIDSTSKEVVRILHQMMDWESRLLE